MPKKLTQKFVDSLKPGTAAVYRATEPKGLLVKVNKHYASYVVQRELWAGPKDARRLVKTCRVTLGRTDDLKLEEAVTRAHDVLAQIRRGIDPNAKTTEHSGVWTVAQAYDQYLSDLVKRGKAERTAGLIRERRDRYLSDWLELPIADVTGKMWVDRHAKIMADVRAKAKNARFDGARSANQTLRDFRAAFNRVAKIDRSLTDNPTYAVEEARERKAFHQIMPDDLRVWAGKVGKLPSRLRQHMHWIGLFSGLRPGNLVAIERAWIDLRQHVISFPAEVMKGRRPFDLPLSLHLEALITEALSIGAALYPGSPYLFPTIEHDSKRRKVRVTNPKVIATKVWKEKTLPNATGHALRHTYSNAAEAAKVSKALRMMLLAQKIPGIEGRYLNDEAQWKQLLEAQAKISAHLLSLIHTTT